jgi:hypothetical protein
MGTKLIFTIVLTSAQFCAPFCLTAQTLSTPPLPIFKEVAEQSGIKFQHYNGMTGKLYLPEIMGSGVALFDFDNDGDLDVFLVQGNLLEPGSKTNATQFPWRGSEPPRGRLFRNDLVVSKDGSRTVKFTDVTEKSGIVANGYGMGAAVGDINNDGRPDLYLSNLGTNQMFLNKGDGTFAEVTKTSRTDDPRWSTSAAFFDYDRDGWLDLMVVNYAIFSPANSPTCYAATSAWDYCTPRVFRAPGNRLFHHGERRRRHFTVFDVRGQRPHWRRCFHATAFIRIRAPIPASGREISFLTA